MAAGNLPVIVFSHLADSVVEGLRNSTAAAAVLDLLQTDGVPLVFWSSKTRVEIEHVQQELGVNHPFISENGAAVFLPKEYFGFELPYARDLPGYRVVEFGRPYLDVVRTLHDTASRLRIPVIGFSDMSVEEVAADCNLPLLQARLATLREYDEPFRIVDQSSSARQQLTRGLRSAHLSCVWAGRYAHAGAVFDKGAGIELLTGLYRRAFGPVLTVGIGASLNDVPLLQRVDRPIFVQSEDDRLLATRVLEAVPAARLTKTSGAIGWADGLVDFAREGHLL